MNARRGSGRSRCRRAGPGGAPLPVCSGDGARDQRDARWAAAGLVSEADHGRIPLTWETFGGLLTHWLDHIKARGRAPKAFVEIRHMAAAIS